MCVCVLDAKTCEAFAKRAGRAYVEGRPVGKAFPGKPLTGQGALAEAGKVAYEEGGKGC